MNATHHAPARLAAVLEHEAHRIRLDRRIQRQGLRLESRFQVCPWAADIAAWIAPEAPDNRRAIRSWLAAQPASIRADELEARFRRVLFDIEEACR